MRRAAAGLLAGLFAVALAVAPAAQEPPSRELDEARREVERIQRALQEIDREIQRLQRAGRTAEANFQLSDRRWKQKREEVRLHQARMRVVRRELASTQGEVDRLRRSLHERRGLLDRRAVALFKRTRTAEYEVLASAADLVDLGRRARFLEAIARADADLIERTVRSKEAVEKAVERLTKKKREMDGIQRELNGALAAEQRARITAREAKNRADRETAAARRRREEMTRNLASMRALIQRLQQRAGRIEGVARRGRLAWPVRGETFVPQELAGVLGGVYIRTSLGTSVGAAAPGKVIHAGALRGFGTTVIVGHADNVVTVYGNLSDAAVSAGREVQSGTVLGRAGTSQYGPVVFFSVRVNNVAQDVNAWLGS